MVCIYIFNSTFGTIFGTRKLFFEKIHPCGNHNKHNTSRVLYIPLYPTNSQIFGTKPLPRRRFLQHYYRDTFIESHRKPPKAHRSPIDVLQWSPNLQHAYSNALLCITKTHHIGKHILHLSIMCR